MCNTNTEHSTVWVKPGLFGVHGVPASPKTLAMPLLWVDLEFEEILWVDFEFEENNFRRLHPWPFLWCHLLDCETSWIFKQQQKFVILVTNSRWWFLNSLMILPCSTINLWRDPLTFKPPGLRENQGRVSTFAKQLQNHAKLRPRRPYVKIWDKSAVLEPYQCK